MLLLFAKIGDQLNGRFNGTAPNPKPHCHMRCQIGKTINQVKLCSGCLCGMLYL